MSAVIEFTYGPFKGTVSVEREVDAKAAAAIIKSFAAELGYTSLQTQVRTAIAACEKELGAC